MNDRMPTAGQDADTLARAYIDALAAVENVKIKSMIRGSEQKDSVASILDDLDDDAEDIDGPHLRVDLVMAAVLTAKAVAGEGGLAKRLRKEAPVVTIETHTADMVQQVKTIIEDCAAAGNKRRYVLGRDGSERSHAPEKGNADILGALNSRLLTVGIAPDSRRYLPNTLLRTAEYRLVLPTVDEWAVGLVVEAITGEVVMDPIDPHLVRLADMSDLSLAFRRGFSASECMTRLAKLVAEKSAHAADGPVLSQLFGYGEAMSWALDLVKDLEEYRAGRLDWDLIDNTSVLLEGPPGTGKTTFAASLARTAGIPIVSTSVAEWNCANYLSGTLQMIRDVFGRARRLAPCVLLVDELDGISDRAGLSGDYVEYWSQIINFLLEHLSGLAENKGVVIIGATNFAQRIDPAIRRAGRLDRQIVVSKPGADDLAKIFGHYLAGTSLQDADLMPAALASRDKTGADVAAYVKRAKAKARREQRELVLPDLLDQIREGEPRMLQAVRHRVSIHEAGHVVVGRALRVGNFMAASITHFGGEAAFAEAIDPSSTTGRLEDFICLMLGGRAAERIVLGDIAIGSGLEDNSDLARATAVSQLIETAGGGAVRNIRLPGDDRTLLVVPGLLDAVKVRLDRVEARATSIIEANRPLLERVAARLEAEGYLSADDVEALEVATGTMEAAE